MALPSKIVSQLRAICGQDAVLTDDADLLVYEYDAVTTHKAHPLAVIFPQTTEHVAQAVRLLMEYGIPRADSVPKTALIEAGHAGSETLDTVADAETGET